MKSSVALQLFLLADVFVMGMLASLAIRHGRAHRVQKKLLAQEESSTATAGSNLSTDVQTRILKTAETNFQNSIAATTAELEQNLAQTTEHINSVLNTVGTEVIGNELEQYRAELAALRQQAATQLSGVSEAVSKHEAQLRADMEQAVAAEKDRLVALIDTHLSDAVASFLTETLQHNVDLGAQTAYLTAMLQDHKTELAEGIKHVGR